MKTKEKMTRMMAEMTGQPLEKVKQDVERDYFMSAQEALDYHIIDEIYQQTNNMLENILISIILYNFATSTLQKGQITRITTHKNEAI
jgi:membrane-bound ClpP family serine protease